MNRLWFPFIGCLACLLACFQCGAVEPVTNLGPVNPPAKTQTEIKQPGYVFAVVGVHASTGSGSGVMVKHKGTGAIVLTNWHIVEDDSTVEMESTLNGERFRGAVWHTDKQHDLAIIHCPNARPRFAVPLASTLPKVGDTVEVIGKGAMQPTIGKVRYRRAWLTNNDDTRLQANCQLFSGDSGGGFFCRGALLGINRGGSVWLDGKGGRPRKGTTDRIGQFWPASVPATADVGGSTLCQIVRRICTPRGCGPVCVPCPSISVLEPAPPVAPPPVQTQPQAPPEVDLNELARIIVEQHGDKLRGDDGSPGKDGQPGPPGKDGKPGSDAQDAPPLDKIVEAVLADPERLAKRMQPHLDPIFPAWVDAEGNVIDQIPGGVSLGEALPLRITREVIDAP